MKKYLIFHKPFGVLSQFTDRDGRSTLADFVPFPNIYPVGRLDRDSEGLMLLTNDGALIHRISSPDHKVRKTYWVQVEGVPLESSLEELRQGVFVKGRLTRPANVNLLTSEPSVPPRSTPIRFRKTVPTAWLQIRLQEGMNRQIRRMTAFVGHPTLRVIRVGIGPFQLGSLQPGQWQWLEPENVSRIFHENPH